MAGFGWSAYYVSFYFVIIVVISVNSEVKAKSLTYQ